MTPERQRWWDSLPTEEKRIRKGVEDEKEMLSHFKNALKYRPNKAHYKNVISKEKSVIKALRKEIAQRPVMRTQPPTASPYKCPCCGASLMYLLRCVKCGQKLRWENDRTCWPLLQEL